MTAENYIQALPKIELNLQFEGAVPRETLLMLADQNEIRDSVKRFDKWLARYESPDFKKLNDLLEMLRSWIVYGDDLTRAVYDIGVALSKDNVRYAEINIDPLSYVTGDLTFEAFLAALNDGRDRVERAWGVQMRWVMTLPRAKPRQADEVARWAISHTALDSGVVGVALGRTDATKINSVDQFERAFRIAEKKSIGCIAHLDTRDDVDETIDLLGLDRIIDAWGIAESPETLASLAERHVTLCLGALRAKHYGWIKSVPDYPIEALKTNSVPYIINSEMPSLFRHNLTNEYLALYQSKLATLDDIEQLIQETLAVSYLDEGDKTMLAALIDAEVEGLREAHLSEADETNS